MNTNNNFQNHFSNLTQDELRIIQQAENQINQNSKDKVVLIAYDSTQQ